MKPYKGKKMFIHYFFLIINLLFFSKHASFFMNIKCYQGLTIRENAIKASAREVLENFLIIDMLGTLSLPHLCDCYMTTQ